MPATMRAGDWLCASCGFHNFASRQACNNCGTPKPGDDGGAAMAGGMAGGLPGSNGQTFKAGDWLCSACGNHNFAYRDSCKQCGAPKAGGGATPMPASGGGAVKPGDWLCPNCSFHNFASRAVCNKCGTPKPEEGGAMGWEGMGMQSYGYGPATSKGRPAPGPYGKGPPPNSLSHIKEGDWFCLQCGNHNFAYRVNCKQCGAVRDGFKDGDWVCKSCWHHNFAKRGACEKCGAPRPEDMGQLGKGVYMSGATMGGKGGGKDGGGKAGGNNIVREGDWICAECGNNNFARRTECHRCGAPKPE